MIKLIVEKKSSFIFILFFLIGEYNKKKRRFYTHNMTKKEVYETKREKKEWMNMDIIENELLT